MSKVSIVVPVYNAASSLCRCLDSLANQTHADLEILLINDGSTDNSEKICRDYMNADPRFHLHTQVNAGPAAARNRGIDMATGEYITFVDSDDYVTEDMVATMLAAAEASDAQITVCSYWIEKGDVRVEAKYAYPPGVYEGEQCRGVSVDTIDITHKKGIPPYSWVRMVRREFLQGLTLRFDERIIRSEDYLYWVQVHFCADCLCLATDKPLYYYVETAGSITRRYIKGYWEMARTIYDTLKTKLPDDAEIAAALEHMQVHRSMIALNNASRHPEKEGFLADAGQVIRDQELRRIIRKMPVAQGVREHGAYFILMKLRLYFVVRMRYRLKR